MTNRPIPSGLRACNAAGDPPCCADDRQRVAGTLRQRPRGSDGVPPCRRELGSGDKVVRRPSKGRGYYQDDGPT